MLDIRLYLVEAPTEPWKIFIQSREQFTCSGLFFYSLIHDESNIIIHESF